LYEIATKRKLEASRRQITEGKRKESWTQYGNKGFSAAMEEFGYTKKDPPF